MARKTEGKLADSQRENSAQPVEIALLLALGSIAVMPPAHAEPFVITNGQTVTETQVLNTDETGTVETGGTISTTGEGGNGINSDGGNVTITNSGTIHTTGERAYGINSDGDNVTITQSGSIHTTGDNAHGINSDGDNVTLTHSGTISTTGKFAHGIFTTGGNVTLTHSGTIHTTGRAARGITSFHASATLTHSGSIHTAGVDADGIISFGASATLTNSGTIHTTGRIASGINSNGRNATLTNSGTIISNNRGIDSYGDSATITNRGTIITEGDGARGITSFGASATITNSGLISATGSGSAAILGSSTAQETLNLLPGSRILGAIDLGGGGDTVNIYGTSGSAVLTFANADTINTLTANAVRLANTNTVVVIDPTGESSRAQSLTALSTGIHNVISQGQQTVALMRPVKLAALEMTPGTLNLDTAPMAWGQVFGSQSRKGNDGQMLGFEHRYAGLIGGYEQAYRGDRMGLVAGVANGNTSSAMSGMDSDSVFVGLYRHTRLGELKMTGSLVAGVERHSSQRKVLDNLNGVETVRGSTASYYLSPSVSISRSYAVAPVWELRPSAVLGYSVGWYAGYTESGSTSVNLTLGARRVQALTGRAQLEMARQTGWGEVSVRAGMQMRQTSQGAATGTVGGSDFRFSAAGSNNATGSYMGLGVRQVLRERLSLVADVEVGELSGKEKHVGARVTLQYMF